MSKTRFIYRDTPTGLAEYALVVAETLWGSPVQTQTHLDCPGFDGYVGDFTTPGHGGLVAISRQAIQHPLASSMELLEDVYPPTFPSNAARVEVVRYNRAVHTYAFEEEVDWAVLPLALPAVRPALARLRNVDMATLDQVVTMVIGEWHTDRTARQGQP